MATAYNTGSRKKILAYLTENADRTVSAKDIAKHTQEQGAPVNITTVYRYLDRLEQEGAVIKYASTAGEKAVYQYVGAGRCCGEHLHLKCIDCGKVFHLDCHFMDEISDHVEKEHGFTLQCRNSVIYGRCSSCLQNRKKV